MAKIRYISLFSGIEAWSCAVAGMPEYEAVAFAEVDPFACAVLKHHYPDVPNLGDVTKIDGRKYRGIVNLIVGGSPCQGFSIAGQRKGLNDERSCLALEYVRLVEEMRPRWLLWENVPGCFSTSAGQDLRSFFAALANIGYSLSWTVLDSQYFGVAQRRRRVFACGYLGDWTYPAKVLFEPSCLSRNPPPRRKAGKGDSRSAEAGTGNGRLAGTLCASGAGLDRPSASGNQLDYCVVDSPAYAVRTAQTGPTASASPKGSAHTLNGAGVQAVAVERERERDGSLRNGVGSALREGLQERDQHDRRQAHRSTASGKQTFPTLTSCMGSKLWLGNQEAFSGDYFIKEPR